MCCWFMRAHLLHLHSGTSSDWYMPWPVEHTQAIDCAPRRLWYYLGTARYLQGGSLELDCSFETLLSWLHVFACLSVQHYLVHLQANSSVLFCAPTNLCT